MPSDQELWTRISEFPLDNGNGGMARRLPAHASLRAIEADAAIEEYRRFLYLTETSVLQSRPSPVIYKIWLLHKETFSDSWHRYLAQVSQGPRRFNKITAPNDNPRHAEAYRNTRAFYEREFGHPPPARFWPEVAIDTKHEDNLVGPRTIAEAMVFVCLALALATPSVVMFTGISPLLGASVAMVLLVLSILFMVRARNLKSRKFPILSLFRSRKRS